MNWKDIIKMPNEGIALRYNAIDVSESSDGLSLEAYFKDKHDAFNFAEDMERNGYIVTGPRESVQRKTYDIGWYVKIQQNLR